MEACCLDVDLATMSDGDSTLIGDRGVTLSGGQRQRVSLARAVYSDRDVYLLDDPLAAVDPDVALTVFRRVVLDLLVGKTVLLVTHQPQVIGLCQILDVVPTGPFGALGDKLSHRVRSPFTSSWVPVTRIVYKSSLSVCLYV